VCGPVPARSIGRPWDGRFAGHWLAPDLALLRADSASWPSPGNVLVVTDDDGAALIDCGFGTEHGLEALAAALAEAGLALASVHTVLCTHPHTDHAGAAAALAAGADGITGRRLLVPAGSRPTLDDPALVAASILPPETVAFAPWLKGLDVDAHFRSDCGATALAPGQEITEVGDGDVIRLGAYEWTAVATPGHDAHLLCYHERRTGMFVYSDLLSTRGTAIPWYAPGGGGTGAYLDSLRRVAALDPALGISGHGGLLEGRDAVTASVAATAAHITGRTGRITAALASGPVSFTDLERCVYPPVVHEVIPWASSVAAVHLLEALDEGRATPTGEGRYQLTGGHP
jgi:glyoxylase-like metal-dependent hydrolase (beta-lactamase superfamily II)